MREHHQSIQSIAKWFEEGCSQTDNGNSVSTCPKSSEETSYNNNTFSILDCTDICLLSKLPDVPNQTLLDRAQKQLQAIEELPARKDRLLTISYELFVNGRRSVALRLLTDQIEACSLLFCLFSTEMLFQRALLYLKSRQLSEALFDIYIALNIVDKTASSSGGKSTDDNNNMMQQFDQIHVHILEEIKKCLTSSNNEADAKQIIFIDNIGNVSFEEVLKQYDSLICKNFKQRFMNFEENFAVQNDTQKEEEKQEISKEGWPNIDQQTFINSEENQSCCLEVLLSCSNFTESFSSKKQASLTNKPTYKSVLIDGGDKTKNKEANGEKGKETNQFNTTNENHNSSYNNLIKSKTEENEEEDKPGHSFPSSPSSNNSENSSEKNNQLALYREISYSVKVGFPKKEVIKVQQKLMGNENAYNQKWLVENLFNMHALHVDKLVSGTALSTITQIFSAFGNIVNARYVQMDPNTSSRRVAAIVEYDNADSPRMAISYLSQVSLPHVGQPPDQCLSFRFNPSSKQHNLRICKENQDPSSNECYFWRTTGCKYAEKEDGSGCKFYHNRLAKGVEFQEWMTSKQQNGHKQQQQLKTRYNQNDKGRNGQVGKSNNINNRIF